MNNQQFETDETTIDDPLFNEQLLNQNNQLNINENKKQITKEILKLALQIGLTFHESEENEKTKDLIKEFLPSFTIPFPHLKMNEDEFERYRIIFISKIDQCYDKRFTLLLVFIFNIGILLQRFFVIYHSLSPTKSYEIKKHQNALKKYVERIQIILSEEFYSYLNNLINLYIPSNIDIRSNYLKIVNHFNWDDNLRDKWILHLHLKIYK